MREGIIDGGGDVERRAGDVVGRDREDGKGRGMMERDKRGRRVGMKECEGGGVRGGEENNEAGGKRREERQGSEQRRRNKESRPDLQTEVTIELTFSFSSSMVFLILKQYASKLKEKDGK